MRDIDKRPYTADEQRVAEFFSQCGTGGGDDPIGSIIASHAYLAAERNRFRRALEKMAKDPPANLDEPDLDWEVVQKMRAIAREALAQPNGER